MMGRLVSFSQHTFTAYALHLRIYVKDSSRKLLLGHAMQKHLVGRMADTERSEISQVQFILLALRHPYRSRIDPHR